MIFMFVGNVERQYYATTIGRVQSTHAMMSSPWLCLLQEVYLETASMKTFMTVSYMQDKLDFQCGEHLVAYQNLY